MKKTLLALAFASAGLLAVPAAFAQSAPTHNDGWFVNGNVGRTSIDKGPYDDHDTGYAIGGGYRWAVFTSTRPYGNTINLPAVQQDYSDTNNYSPMLNTSAVWPGQPPLTGSSLRRRSASMPGSAKAMKGSGVCSLPM